MTLKWTLVSKGMRPHGPLREKLQTKVDKLSTHLEHFPPDAVSLQVSLQRQPRKEWFDVGLTLWLPSNILRAEKSGADPIPALDQAIKTLLREVSVYKSELRRESQWQPSERPEIVPEPSRPPRLAVIRAAKSPSA